MDNNNSNYPPNRSRPSDHLGLNKISKNIRKSPLHQPNHNNYSNPKQHQQSHQQQQQQNNSNNNQQQQPQPQPQVYNISKNDFRSIVQQLTGTPTRDPFPSSNNPPNPRPPHPAHNPPKPPSMRLQKIRPPPLTPIARPQIHHNPHPNPNPIPNPNSNLYPRPGPAVAQSPAASFSPLLPPTPPPGSSFWGNTLESPISAYMRYLENSILHSDGTRQASQLQPQPPPSQVQQIPPPHQAPLPSPGQGLLPNPHLGAPFPSPRGPPPDVLPSPTSQFLLPSPSVFLNLLSPRSPYPLLSPRFQYPPLTNFPFSPMGGQSGLLGPGPQPPPSPGLLFPPSPSGFLPIMSPRWRDL